MRHGSFSGLAQTQRSPLSAAWKDVDDLPKPKKTEPSLGNHERSSDSESVSGSDESSVTRAFPSSWENCGSPAKLRRDVPELAASGLTTHTVTSSCDVYR